MIVTRLSGMNFDKTKVDSLNDQLGIYVSLTRVPKYHACISHNVILISYFFALKQLNHSLKLIEQKITVFVLFSKDKLKELAMIQFSFIFEVTDCTPFRLNQENLIF